MIPTWDDFDSKYGFNDGASAEEKDYAARDLIIAELNRQQPMKDALIRAVAYDRPGFHNGCLIVLLPDTAGASDDDLVRSWSLNKIQEVELPDEIDVEEIIGQAYDEAA